MKRITSFVLVISLIFCTTVVSMGITSDKGLRGFESNHDQSQTVMAIIKIEDIEKREQILSLLEPTYVSTSDLCEQTDREMEKDSVRIINELSALSVPELKERYQKKLYESIELAKENPEIYFTEEGIAAARTYFPEEVKYIKAYSPENITESQKVVDRTTRAPNRSYTKTNTVVWNSLEVIGFRLKVTIFWTVKNNKIIAKSSSASTSTNGLWKRKSLTKSIDTIDYRGFGHIQYKAVFQRLAGLPVLRHAYNGAWFYIDGGCDWN